MDPWALWIIAALVLGIGEVVTGGLLYLGMLAVGALAGGAASALTGNEWIAFAVFAGSSLAMIGLVRPVARRHLTVPIESRSGAAALLGAEARVLATVDGADGRIKLQGEVWSARSYDGQTVFPPGATVQVLQIDGATALVA